MVFNLSNHNSVANQFIAELRDVNVQKDSLRFRKNMERMGEVMAYEISKTFDFEQKPIETPLGVAQCVVPTTDIVLVSVLRAGLPFHQGMLNYFDKADSAFISAYRRHHKDGTFEVNLKYISTPEIEGRTLIIADPMLATGASIHASIKALKDHGTPAKIHIATVIAANLGINFIKRQHANTDIWVGAIDDELTARSYIVPGLGDAGDLSFGPKILE